MLLNRLEYALMNNPVRAAIQRRFEGRRLLRMGGAIPGKFALEIGCGRGIGTEIVFSTFGANRVDAFDLDPRMVTLARRRLGHRGSKVRVWVGDARAIAAPDATYDAVFDFGILHHVPDWRGALGEIARVLSPGGTLFAEEVLDRFLARPLTRRVLDHPRDDRFGTAEFARELARHGFEGIETEELWGAFAWFTARKRHREPSRRHPCDGLVR